MIKYYTSILLTLKETLALEKQTIFLRLKRTELLRPSACTGLLHRARQKMAFSPSHLSLGSEGFCVCPGAAEQLCCQKGVERALLELLTTSLQLIKKNKSAVWTQPWLASPFRMPLSAVFKHFLSLSLPPPSFFPHFLFPILHFFKNHTS